MAGGRIINVVRDEKELIIKLSKVIEEKAFPIISEGGDFRVGLSGGSLIAFLCQGLPGISTDWTKWKFFFCDERLVPFDDDDSTFGSYKKKLIGSIPITENQFVVIDPTLNAETAAKDYENKIRNEFKNSELPQFDLLLLGAGPDGHTCSLFPGHNLLKEISRWVAPITDSPKPPASRVTLTYPVINNASCSIFAIAGAAKAETIQKILEGDPLNPLPATLVNSKTVFWLLDEGAAGLLS